MDESGLRLCPVGVSGVVYLGAAAILYNIELCMLQFLHCRFSCRHSSSSASSVMKMAGRSAG